MCKSKSKKEETYIKRCWSILFSWICPYSNKQKIQTKFFYKKNWSLSRTNNWFKMHCINLVENDRDLLGITEQSNLDCNIACYFYHSLLCSTKNIQCWYGVIGKQDLNHFVRHWILNSRARFPFIYILQHVQMSIK